MRRAFAAVAFILLPVLSLFPQIVVLQGIDAVISAGADETLRILPVGGKRTLAVSWFAYEGEKAGVSDYLVTGITTSLANRGGTRVTVVSRQAMDRVLEETSFQMSDLVDPKSQIRIGRQLGADLILTGFITPVSDTYRLNAQMVEIETGVVLGGFTLSFRLEKDFENRLAASTSTVLNVQKRAVEKGGVATVTTVLEDFSGGRTETQLRHLESFEGPDVVAASGKFDIDAKGGPDGSPCGRFSFSAELSTDDPVSRFRESYLVLKAMAKPNTVQKDATGVSLYVKPEGFSLVQVTLIQLKQGVERWFYLTASLNDGEWQDLKIPFALFSPGERGYAFDSTLPVTIGIEVPYLENWRLFHFRSGKEVSASLLMDNVGFFRVRTEDPRFLVDSFDDEVSRAVWSLELSNFSSYMDYSRSEEGVERKTPGLSGVRANILRREGGPAGRFLSVSVHADIDQTFGALGDQTPSLQLVLTADTGKSWDGFSDFSFFARSDLVEDAAVQYQDNETEIGYSATNFALTGVWSRIAVPFSEVSSDSGTLLEAKNWPRCPVVRFYFDIPPAAMKEAARKGSLDFEVGLDQLVLE